MSTTKEEYTFINNIKHFAQVLNIEGDGQMMVLPYIKVKESDFYKSTLNVDDIVVYHHLVKIDEAEIKPLPWYLNASLVVAGDYWGIIKKGPVVPEEDLVYPLTVPFEELYNMDLVLGHLLTCPSMPGVCLIKESDRFDWSMDF